MGTRVLDGGGYIEQPGTEGKPIVWWFYEDHKYSLKRLIAAAGFTPDEISFEGVTFDEMRAGCWQPQARVAEFVRAGENGQKTLTGDAAQGIDSREFRRFAQMQRFAKSPAHFVWFSPVDWKRSILGAFQGPAHGIVPGRNDGRPARQSRAIADRSNSRKSGKPTRLDRFHSST